MKILASLLIGTALVGLSPRAVLASPNDAMAERGVTLLESGAALVDQDKGSCDKMGGDMSTFIDAHASDIQALQAWGARLTVVERMALASKYKARLRAAEARLRGSIEPCQENAKVRAALKKVGIGG